MVKRKALVTGGAGFIGSHLCNKLIKNNYDVIAYDDLSNGSGKKNLVKDVKFVKGDITHAKKI
jgi:UDP-glucose 4-epimerase